MVETTYESIYEIIREFLKFSNKKEFENYGVLLLIIWSDKLFKHFPGVLVSRPVGESDMNVYVRTTVSFSGAF